MTIRIKAWRLEHDVLAKAAQCVILLDGNVVHVQGFYFAQINRTDVQLVDSSYFEVDRSYAERME